MEKVIEKQGRIEKKAKRVSFAAFFVFLLSPFLSIPILLNDVKNGKSKYISVFISLLFGFLSFRYIPTVTNDKAEYFSLYHKFTILSYVEFERYILSIRKPDFLFNYIIFLFSKVSIDFNLFFFLITTVTVFLILKFLITVSQRIENLKESNRYLLFFLFLITLSLSALLSQVRFYFAASIFVWAVYYLVFERKIWRGVILIILTLSTHFSFAFFLPAVIIVALYHQKINSKLILIFSLIFYFSNRLVFFDLLQGVLLPENYLTKIEVYKVRDVDYSANAALLHNLRFLWLYVATVFLILYKHKKTLLFTLSALILALINITNQDEFIFGRFSIVFSIFFILFLVECKVNRRIDPFVFKRFIELFFVALSVHFLTMRYNIMASYSIETLFSVFNIFSNSITPNDFLH